MKIYCPRCGEEIDPLEKRLRLDSRGRYWHETCYKEELEEDWERLVVSCYD